MPRRRPTPSSTAAHPQHRLWRRPALQGAGGTIRAMREDEARLRVGGGATAGLLSAAAGTDRCESLGAVRGRVETRSHRRGLRFSLYDLVDAAAATCYPTSDMEAAIRHARGRHADVTDTVRRDPATGRPLSIRDITSVDLVEEGSRTGHRAARGVLGTDEPAQVLIRRVRDGQ